MKSFGKEMIPVSIGAAIILTAPLYLTNNFLLTIVCIGMIYAIVAMGLNFITGLAGLMNLGAAAVFALGAYTSALFTVNDGISPWLALLPTLAMGLIIGKGLGYPSLRIHGVYLTLTTIGLNEIIRLLISNLGFTNGVMGVRNIPPYRLFGFEISTPLRSYYFLFCIMVVFIIIARRIVASKWGRVFLAAKDNPEALETCGVSLSATKIAAFTLSTVFGCLAGALYAHFIRFISPTTFTLELSITFVMMLIIGGLGSFWGSIVGAFVVAILPEMIRFLGTPHRLVYALIMMALIVFFPVGIQKEIKRLIRFIRDQRKLKKGGALNE